MAELHSRIPTLASLNVPKPWGTRDSNLIEREFENNFATKLELEQRSLFVVVSFFKENFFSNLLSEMEN